MLIEWVLLGFRIQHPLLLAIFRCHNTLETIYLWCLLIRGNWQILYLIYIIEKATFALKMFEKIFYSILYFYSDFLNMIKFEEDFIFPNPTQIAIIITFSFCNTVHWKCDWIFKECFSIEAKQINCFLKSKNTYN